MSDAVDLDGDPRIAFGRSSLTVDMGAYEYYSFRIVKVVGKAVEGGMLVWTWASRSGETLLGKASALPDFPQPLAKVLG